MNALLVRVGADLSLGGGSWNGPVDTRTREFAYVAIPETHAVHPGMERPYSALEPVLSKFGVTLPQHLRRRHMHLDPDFAHFTYGDQGARAKQMRERLEPGDKIVFYASLADVSRNRKLVYSIIGLFVVDEIVPATSVPMTAQDTNAHSRRLLTDGCQGHSRHVHPIALAFYSTRPICPNTNGGCFDFSVGLRRHSGCCR